MLNVFVCLKGQGRWVGLGITDLESKEAVQEGIRAAGGTEEVVAFVSVKGHLADAVNALALGQEDVDSWEAFLKTFVDLGFELGIKIGKEEK